LVWGGFVRITGVLADYTRESTIEADGTFVLNNVLEGRSLIVVVAQDTVAGIAFSDVPQKEPVEIQLRKDPFAAATNR
jgi:hypothetical protein